MTAAHEYEIFGCTLLSSVPIPELPDVRRAAELSEGTLRLVVDNDGALPEPPDWTPLWVNDAGVAWLKVHIESKQRYSLRFRGLVDFIVEVQPGERPDITMTCFPCEGVPEFTIRHIVLDQAIPLVLSYFGRILLHMAVVKIGDVGVGFLGKSGQGKSTLTAEFSRNGHVAVSDDTVLLHCEDQRYSAISNYPGVRLWSDSHEQLMNETQYSEAAHYTTKRRVVADDLDFSAEPVPLAAFFFLDDPTETPGEIRVTRLGFSKATASLIESKFRLETGSKPAMKEEFEAISELAATVPCFSVAYPRDYALVSKVRETLVAETLKIVEPGGSGN